MLLCVQSCSQKRDGEEGAVPVSERKLQVKTNK